MAAPLTLDDLRDGRAFISVEEFATLPGTPSRGSCYEGVRTGAIPSLRLGSRILIPVPKLLAVLGADFEAPESHATRIVALGDSTGPAA
jgi:hypothetical protein